MSAEAAAPARTCASPAGERLLFAAAYTAFLALNVFYFSLFRGGENLPGLGVVYGVMSTDHGVYSENVIKLETGTYDPGYNNNLGISALYALLKNAFGGDLKLAAFTVNNAVFAVSFLLCLRLLRLLGLPGFYALFLFFNPATVYFSQMMNKESFSLLAVLAITVLAGERRWAWAAAAICLGTLVRVQLAFFGLTFLWLFLGRQFLRNLLIAYLALSLGGALSTRLITSFDPGQWGGGLSQVNFWLNREFLLGSLLLNPARVLQYAADLFLSAGFMRGGVIDLYRFRDLPSAMALAASLPALLYVFLNLGACVRTPARLPIAAAAAYMLVLLMNPMIHARYLFPVLPLVFTLPLFLVYNMRGAAVRKGALQ